MDTSRGLTQIYTHVDVQQKCIRFQVDTGATCNVLREDDLPEEAQILAGLEKFSLCHSPHWIHSQKFSRQTWTRTQNLVAKAEHQREELQNGAKKHENCRYT